MKSSEAQSGPARGGGEAGLRNAPSAAANGEAVKAARINNWTLGVAAGLLEGSFIRFASELAKALDDGDNLRILPIVTYGAVVAPHSRICPREPSRCQRSELANGGGTPAGIGHVHTSDGAA